MAPFSFWRWPRSLIFTVIFYLLVLLFAASVTFLGATIIGASLSVMTDAISEISYQSFLACRVFSIPLFLVALSAWSLFTSLPILCFASRSGRLWYRRNVARLLLWNVQGLKAAVLGFGVCAALGVVSADLAVVVASAVSLAYLCEAFRSRLALVLGYLLPSRALSLLVGKPRATGFGGMALLRTRALLGWWTMGFVRITGVPSTLRGLEGVRDALFGAAEAEIPLGYALRFDGDFSLYFFTGVMTRLGDDWNEALRRLEVLRQTVSACLPEAEVEAVADTEELLRLVRLPEGTRLSARGDVLRLASGVETGYFAAVGVAGLPAYKEERLSGLIETMLSQRVEAVYMAMVNPVGGVVESLAARLRYREALRRLQSVEGVLRRVNPLQEEVAFRSALNGSSLSRLFQVSVLIGLSCGEEERLRTALRAVRVAVQSEFCSEFSKVRARELLGLELLAGLNACRFSAPARGGTVMTASDASRFLRLPSRKTPGLASTVAMKPALPRRTEQAVDGVELGVIVRNGKSLGQRAVLPVRSLVRHVAVFGTTGMGKTTFVKGLLLRLIRDFGMNVLVFDPTSEYADLVDSAPGVRVLSPMSDEVSVNVLEVPDGVERDIHIEHILEALHLLFGNWSPDLEELARSSLHALYEQKEAPTISDWIPVTREIGSRGHVEVRATLDFLSSRLEKLTIDAYGRMFNTPHTSIRVGELFESSTVFDLHEMDGDSQAFLLGAVLAQLQNHAGSRKSLERPLVVCVEEAHVFAPEILEAGSSRKAIVRRPVARMLSEMGELNVGVILIDQCPSQVASDALANCNTLVAFRLLEDRDKQTVIRSLGFSPSSGEGLTLGGYLSNLDVGEAIVRTPISGMPYEIRVKLPERTLKLPGLGEGAVAILSAKVRKRPS